MLALIKKEINSFFASPIGYLVIGVFLVLNGLFLWVFSGNFNIFDNGFADLAPFFELAPWVFIFLIPAVTMRTFSEEKRMGTLELLLTKPISLKNIVLGKYFGALLLIFLALLPTILYVFTISDLGNPSGNWDVGSTIGSYIGLLFLAMAYTAIGVFASTLSENQIVAFIIAVLLSFIMYYAFDGLSSIISALDISFLGMQSHFNSVARGVLDTRDIIYFLSVSGLFLVLTFLNLKKS
jgi:ABC-2 type transport system permease protein